MVIERVVETEAGQKFKVATGIKHALWSISVEDGPLPSALDGSWTYYADAVKAIDRYVKSRPAARRTAVKKEA